ncbi:hypothetical protein ZEAMMB73_Zm00001d040563 [Zea mays]|uniref:Uncharacterized protein n=1 Tax=Zea mays TaxID=4577 RepID=A0A1D6MRE7_MAIZE|nr:hypothetical protein ZEAMMB73_Zm00001d040563 [Zea mays]
MPCPPSPMPSPSPQAGSLSRLAWLYVVVAGCADRTIVSGLLEKSSSNI